MMEYLKKTTAYSIRMPKSTAALRFLSPVMLADGPMNRNYDNPCIKTALNKSRKQVTPQS